MTYSNKIVFLNLFYLKIVTFFKNLRVRHNIVKNLTYYFQLLTKKSCKFFSFLVENVTKTMDYIISVWNS